jgi:hypothetical protein
VGGRVEARGILAVNDRAAVAANKVDQAARAARVVVSRAVAVARVDQVEVRAAAKEAAEAVVRVDREAGNRAAQAEEVSKAGQEVRNGSASKLLRMRWALLRRGGPHPRPYLEAS